MRNALSFIAFSVSCICAQAQSSAYHPFPTTTAVWRSNHQSSSGTDDTFFRQMEGDTVIGAYTYKKVYDVSGSMLYYSGAIRQDIPNKKVYWLNTFGSESLLYDFNRSI